MTHVLADRFRRVLTASLLLVVGGAVVTWLCWPAAVSAPEVRARQYGPFSQCVLTDAAGIGSPKAAPVWAGLQAASSATAAKSSFLAIPAATVPDDAVTYANTLVARGCDVIVAVGPAQVHAVSVVAAARPALHFVIVGEMAAATNTATIPAGPDASVTSAVTALLTAAFRGHFTGGLVTP